MNRSEKLQDIVENRDGLSLVLKDDTNVRLNLVYATLKHRGVENRSNFINPLYYPKTKVKEIHNIDQMLKVEQTIKAGHNVGVLVDVDCDGMTSGAMFINYFNDNYKNAHLVPIFPKGKLHGVKKNLDIIKEYCEGYDLQYVVLPDSSSNDLKAIRELEDIDVKVVVIDHHDVENKVVEDDPECIINNQMPFNGDSVNKNFTGAGMVFQALRYLDMRNHVDYATGYLDLFALGQIGDMSDISNLEVRALMLRGFNAINNPLIRRYVDKNHTQMSPKALQFSIIPLINAVMRVGSVEEKNTLFKALIKDDSGDYQISKRKNVNHHFVYEDIDVDIYDYAIKLMETAKASQKKMTTKALKDATYLSDTEDNFNLVLFDKIEGGITGLVANQLLGDTGKASFVLVKNSHGSYNGSMRIPMAYNDTLERLHDNFKELGNLVFAQGHENAAGVGFKLDENNQEQTIDILNEMFVPVKGVHVVDDYFINDTPSIATITSVDDMANCFGGKVSEPVVGVLGLKVTADQFKLNKKTMHITVGGIDFIKFNMSDEEIEFVEDRLDESYNLYVDMVGTVGINRFLGKTTPQFIIDDMQFSTRIDEEIDDSLVF